MSLFNKSSVRICLLLMVTFLFQGCTSVQDKMLNDLRGSYATASTSIESLRQSIENKRFSNIHILNEYGSIVKKSSPDFAKAVDVILLEGTTKGMLFSNLKSRLDSVDKWIVANANTSFNENAYYKQKEELSAIQMASRDFNNMLGDSVNVIAGLSNGKLAKIDYPEVSSASSGSGIVGSEYVGNPAYGHWSTDSSGYSFWEWYGMYSLFAGLNKPIYQDRYYRSYGGYSYYDRNGYSYQSSRYRNDHLSRYKESNYLKSNPKAMDKVSPKARPKKKSNTFGASGKTSNIGSHNKKVSSGSSSNVVKKSSNTFGNSFRSSRSSRSSGGFGK